MKNIKWFIFLFLIYIFCQSASVPKVITFQGRLYDNGAPVTATRNMRFEIVKPTGTAVWQSHASNQVQVGVNNGIYNVKLGDTSLANMAALDNNYLDQLTTVNLRVYVEGVQLQPDIQLSSVPFALMSKQTETITKNSAAGNSISDALGQASKPAILPKMTNNQINAISNPVTGSIVFNTTEEQLYWYDGSYWLPMGGTSANASYDTGWKACSSWTNQHLGSELGGNVTHNLNIDLGNLIVKVLICVGSYTTDEEKNNNSFEIDAANTNVGGVAGYQINAIDSNTFRVQTGAAEITIINESGGGYGLTSQAGFYKVIVFKPRSIIKGANASDFIQKTGDTMTGALAINNNLTVDTAVLKVDATNNNVGIGTSSPANNAILEVSSNSKTFVVPRMTNAQIMAISSPATGSIVYDKDLKGLSWYNGSGWYPFSIQGEPIGSVTSYFGISAPAGWLICDGGTLGKTGSGATYAGDDYKTLYTLIWNLIKNGNIATSYATGTLGSTASGDWDGGSIKVYLPDLRGVFVRGSGTSAKLQNANGSYFAGTLGAYQNDKMQGHWHSLYEDTNSSALKTDSGFTLGSNKWGITHDSGNGSATSARGPIADGSNGTPRTGTETNPANVAMQYIIKYKYVSAYADGSGSSGSVDLSNYVQKSGSTMTGPLIINSNLSVNGSVSYKVVSKTSAYTAADETVILVNASSGAVTISLPAASGVNGRVYYIKKTDSSTYSVTIDPNGSETIDGSTTKVITSQNDTYTIICDGSNWWMI